MRPRHKIELVLVHNEHPYTVLAKLCVLIISLSSKAPAAAAAAAAAVLQVVAAAAVVVVVVAGGCCCCSCSDRLKVRDAISEGLLARPRLRCGLIEFACF